MYYLTEALGHDVGYMDRDVFFPYTSWQAGLQQRLSNTEYRLFERLYAFMQRPRQRGVLRNLDLKEYVLDETLANSEDLAYCLGDVVCTLTKWQGTYGHRAGLPQKDNWAGCRLDIVNKKI
jgi:hypothetical protein